MLDKIIQHILQLPITGEYINVGSIPEDQNDIFSKECLEKLIELGVSSNEANRFITSCWHGSRSNVELEEYDNWFDADLAILHILNVIDKPYFDVDLEIEGYNNTCISVYASNNKHEYDAKKAIGKDLEGVLDL